MARKEIPFVTEVCPHCGSEITFKATIRWHECPICGLYIKPCALCDCNNINCMCECPLDLIDKPAERIGEHLIDELIKHEDYIELVFDWEDDAQNEDGESFKIRANYMPDDGSFRFFEDRYDLNMKFIDCVETDAHLNKQDISVIKRRLRRIAKKIG